MGLLDALNACGRAAPRALAAALDDDAAEAPLAAKIAETVKEVPPQRLCSAPTSPGVLGKCGSRGARSPSSPWYVYLCVCVRVCVGGQVGGALSSLQRLRLVADHFFAARDHTDGPGGPSDPAAGGGDLAARAALVEAAWAELPLRETARVVQDVCRENPQVRRPGQWRDPWV